MLAHFFLRDAFNYAFAKNYFQEALNLINFIRNVLKQNLTFTFLEVKKVFTDCIWLVLEMPWTGISFWRDSVLLLVFIDRCRLFEGRLEVLT